jgi:hypothetical protein
LSQVEINLGKMSDVEEDFITGLGSTSPEQPGYLNTGRNKVNSAASFSLSNNLGCPASVNPTELTNKSIVSNHDTIHMGTANESNISASLEWPLAKGQRSLSRLLNTEPHSSLEQNFYMQHDSDFKVDKRTAEKLDLTSSEERCLGGCVIQ